VLPKTRKRKVGTVQGKLISTLHTNPIIRQEMVVTKTSVAFRALVGCCIFTAIRLLTFAPTKRIPKHPQEDDEDHYDNWNWKNPHGLLGAEGGVKLVSGCPQGLTL
jgi:hypothetical protein